MVWGMALRWGYTGCAEGSVHRACALSCQGVPPQPTGTETESESAATPVLLLQALCHQPTPAPRRALA